MSQNSTPQPDAPSASAIATSSGALPPARPGRTRLVHSCLARAQRWACNAFIAALLLLIFIDGMPTTPEPVRYLFDSTVDRLGIWQGPWYLFSPDPDNQNSRFRAEITYYDGETREWRSPGWERLSPAQAFRKHRQLEYYDKFWSVSREPVWDSLADYLAHSERPGATGAKRPKQVRMIAELAAVNLPPSGPWPKVTAPRAYDESWVVFTKKYP